MEYTKLGRTDLRVSRVGLGSGGPSRLGQATSAAHSASLAVVREALARGVNFFDSSELYGTETLLGEALGETPRDDFVLCTKAEPTRDGVLIDPGTLARKLDASLERLGMDHVDLYLLHGLLPEHYDLACEALVPELLRLREVGKLRFFGISEAYARDPDHRMLSRAALDPWWDALFVGYNALDPTARRFVLPRAAELAIGCVGMFAVSNRLRDADCVRETARQAVERGALRPDFLAADDPLESLCEGARGAASLPEAGYRFALSEPGLHTVLIGTGSVEHLRENLDACEAGALPEAGLQRIYDAFQLGTPDRARRARVSPLSAADRDAYRERGLLCLRGAVDDGTLASLREEAARLMHRTGFQRAENLRVEYREGISGGNVLTKLDPATDLSSRLDEIAHDARILEPVRALLGDEPVLLKDKLIYKPPGHPGFGCHQDHANWTVFSPDALTVFLALDDAPLETGPVEVFPGLHRDGLKLAGGEFRASRAWDTPPEELAEPITMKAGDLLVFDSLLPHRSGPNRSANARRALLLTYSPASSGDRYGDYYRRYVTQRGAGTAANPEAHLEPPVRALDETGCPRIVTGREPSRLEQPPPSPGTHQLALGGEAPPAPCVAAKRRRRPRSKLRRGWKTFRRGVRDAARRLIASPPA